VTCCKVNSWRKINKIELFDDGSKFTGVCTNVGQSSHLSYLYGVINICHLIEYSILITSARKV